MTPADIKYEIKTQNVSLEVACENIAGQVKEEKAYNQMMWLGICTFVTIIFLGIIFTKQSQYKTSTRMVYVCDSIALEKKDSLISVAVFRIDSINRWIDNNYPVEVNCKYSHKK